MVQPQETSEELTDDELELVIGGMTECCFQKYIVDILNTQRPPPDEQRAISAWGPGDLDP